MADTLVPIQRPTLTFRSVVAKAVRDCYAAAAVVLEYGSGGSTVMAAEMPGKRVFSVESDAIWAANLQAYLDQQGIAAGVSLHAVDIGPTGDWGTPTDESGWRRYHHYPLTVWDRADFQHPDVVLVDGRFRLACMATVLTRITRPVVMLVDDYVARPAYHRFETLQKPSRLAGRMARFELLPQALPGAALSWVVDAFLRPK